MDLPILTIPLIAGTGAAAVATPLAAGKVCTDRMTALERALAELPTVVED